MSLWHKAEAARTSVSLGGLKHGLKVLAFLLWHPGIAETADLRMFPEYPE